MKRECAWCGHYLGQSVPLDDKGITHSICLSCSEKVLAEFKVACQQRNPLQDKANYEHGLVLLPRHHLTGA